MQTTNTVRREPLLIYDGDCRFCIYWARYWQRLTGHRVTYAPYQEVAAQYPEIPWAAFQRQRWNTPIDLHISGMGVSYIVMLTAFCVDNGQNLPIWRNLPHFTYWLLPSGIGIPLIFRALGRYRKAVACAGGRQLTGLAEASEPAAARRLRGVSIGRREP